MDVSAYMGSTFLKVEDIRNAPRQVRIKDCQVGQFEKLDLHFEDAMCTALAYQYVEADMNRNLESEDFEEILRSAQPRLIVRVEPANDRTHGLTPFIREIDPGWDEVISEGYDPVDSPFRLSGLLADRHSGYRAVISKYFFGNARSGSQRLGKEGTCLSQSRYRDDARATGKPYAHLKRRAHFQPLKAIETRIGSRDMDVVIKVPRRKFGRRALDSLCSRFRGVP